MARRSILSQLFRQSAGYVYAKFSDRFDFSSDFYAFRVI